MFMLATIARSPMLIFLSRAPFPYSSQAAEDSFDVHNGVFVKGNVAINETGVAMRDSPKTFTVNPSELKVGERIKVLRAVETRQGQVRVMFHKVSAGKSSRRVASSGDGDSTRRTMGGPE